MRCGKYDAGYPDSVEMLTDRCQARPPVAIPPLAMVEPSAVGHAKDLGFVWSRADLAAAFGTPKADRPAELRPVDRVKPLERCSDWHGCEYHILRDNLGEKARQSG